MTLDRSQIKEQLLSAIAETLSIPKFDEYDYKKAIAFPDNKDHREYIKTIQPFLDSIDIAIIYVKKQGYLRLFVIGKCSYTEEF